MSQRLCVFFCVISTFGAACGDDPEGPPVTADPVVALRAMQLEACERQVECGYPLIGTERTVEACVAAQERATGDVPATLGDGAVVLRADRLEACRAALAAATCDDLANRRFEIDPACTTYWEGTVGEGEPCRGGVVNDCEAGLRCSFADETCPGTCVAIPGDCHEGSCGEGDYCDEQARCVPQAALGEACGMTVAGALHESACVDGAACIEGTCVARIAVGQACTGMHEFECAADHVCVCEDASCAALRCAPAPEDGEPCGTSSGCAGGLVCDFATSTCVERKAAGAACNDSFGLCQPGLVCEAGTCVDPDGVVVAPQPLLEAGADCSDGGICPLGTLCRCDTADCPQEDKTCLPGAALGESCAELLQADYSPFVCAEGICDLFETLTCVKPAAPGEACTGSQTFSCGSFLCIDGACAELEETRCEVNP
ncbi:MAG: hypothetical protein IT385_14150 [Deltaproteobacteria bacterium]|nr:hypothetical protein [Deltaproteobacteria bacterium]